jgi:nucleotide-binding universal stress UspA family protein
MNIHSPVVVATDLSPGADEALRQAHQLAHAAKARLTVCHVLPEILGVDPLFPQLRLQETLDGPEIQRRAEDAVLARVAEVLGDAADAVDVRIVTGTAHAGILTVAEQLSAGLLVMGAHGAGNGPPLGRVVERVVRQAHCPVLVVRAHRPGNVLGATDFSDPALPAVEAAVSEARRRGVPPVIIHCMDLLPPLGLVGYEMPPVGADVIAAMRQHWEERLRASLERFGAHGEFLLEEGPAGPTITRKADELPAQLVVMGTHGRTGLRRVLIGSVAEYVVRHASCSVLVVRLAG